MPSAIVLTFIGHSAWLIEHGEHRILIDPFITGNPVATVSANDMQPTHIVLSHAHGDHLGDTIPIAIRTGAQVIATFELANYLAAQGVQQTVGMGIGGARDFSFGRLRFTPAIHSSTTPDGTPCGNPAGLVFTIDGRTVYHAGDTALFSDMKLIGQRDAIDVALLPIGDFFTMGIDDAVIAAEFLAPKLVIPMHYNTFPPIAVDSARFIAALESRGIPGQLLAPGASHTM